MSVPHVNGAELLQLLHWSAETQKQLNALDTDYWDIDRIQSIDLASIDTSLLMV